MPQCVTDHTQLQPKELVVDLRSIPSSPGEEYELVRQYARKDTWLWRPNQLSIAHPRFIKGEAPYARAAPANILDAIIGVGASSCAEVPQILRQFRERHQNGLPWYVLFLGSVYALSSRRYVRTLFCRDPQKPKWVSGVFETGKYKKAQDFPANTVFLLI